MAASWASYPAVAAMADGMLWALMSTGASGPAAARAARKPSAKGSTNPGWLK